MSEITLETKAYAKIILHAAKYPHCAVNGVLLAKSLSGKDVARGQELEIIDSVPLFHHSHYVSPMAEIALSQIEAVAQPSNLFIAGYYAGCENFNDDTIDKCPGQRIAEKIAENYPSAIFVVVDNKELLQHMKSPAIKIYQSHDGKWKQKDETSVIFQDGDVLDIISHLIERGVHKDLVDFDNHLDDLTLDWSNSGIHKLVASLTAASD